MIQLSIAQTGRYSGASGGASGAQLEWWIRKVVLEQLGCTKEENPP